MGNVRPLDDLHQTVLRYLKSVANPIKIEPEQESIFDMGDDYGKLLRYFFFYSLEFK